MNSLAINQLIFLNIINPEWFRSSAVQRLVGLLGGGGGGGGGGFWLRLPESEKAVSHFSVDKIGI